MVKIDWGDMDEEYREIQTKIEHELEPKINTLFNMSDEELLDFRNEYKKFYQKCTDKLQSVMGLGSDWTRMSEQPANEQIFHLYTYLGLVEGVGNMMANMLILLLVANGHDFHINASGTKHAHTFRELERTNVSIGYKLSFLRYYGIETVASVIDTKLRNDIAHFNFEVVGNNKVIIQGKEVGDVVPSNFMRLYVAYVKVMDMFGTIEKTLNW